MSIAVTTSFSNPDPSLKFTTLQALIDQLNVLVTSVINDTITPYVIGSATPSVDDQDKAWIRTDGAGRFLGTYKFYNGFWMLPYPPVGARIGYFSGDPTVNFDGTGFGIPGAGPVASDYWGWQIANGQNGTANLSDQFIIGARMDNVGITGWNAGTQLWRTNVTGAPLTQGGAATITLDGTNTYRPAITQLDVGLFTANGNTHDPSGDLYGVIPADGSDTKTLIPADAGNVTPPAITTVPPFYALAIIAFIGVDKEL